MLVKTIIVFIFLELKPIRPLTAATVVKTTPASSKTNSKEEIPEDNVSQTSVGGGIKGKLAALFSREQTISETTIANKFKQERDKEMEMLQSRFNYNKVSLLLIICNGND